MLELISLSHTSKRPGSDSKPLLTDVSCVVPKGHVLGVIGGTGSGKSTLVQLIAGVLPVQTGAILWQGRDVGQQRLAANAVGIVSSTAALHAQMSVKEHLVSAQLLSIGGVSKRDTLVHADKLMALCGLETLASVRAMELTEAEGRRLSMAVALAADPLLVVADGFTDDLDPKSERELSAMLQSVARANPWRVVINTTSNLAVLTHYDSVLLMHEGCVCFHGPARALPHYFSMDHTHDLYSRLAMRPVSRWQSSWSKHSDSYYAAFKLTRGRGEEEKLAAASDDDDRVSLKANKPVDPDLEGERAPEPAPPAKLSTQVQVLVQRRSTMFRRVRGSWLGQAAMVLITGGLLILFMRQSAQSQGTRAAVSASGLFALQTFAVLALAVLTWSRELASRHPVWQREARAGLTLRARITALLLMALPLALLHGVVIGFVPQLLTGGVGGDAPTRSLLFIFASVAATMIVSGISAISRSADQASARSWAWAAVQVPLCGALVAWPAGLASLVQPFLTGGYAWSGACDTLKHSPHFEALEAANGTWFTSPSLALGMLALHALVGLALIVIGLRRAIAVR